MEQAYELAEQPALSGSPERQAALAVVANFALWSAEPERTMQVGAQLLGLAERSADPQQLLVAHFLMGSAQWLRAELTLARTHLEKALALHDRRPYHTSDILFGFDIGIICHAWQACVLWLLGHPDQASRCLQEALRAAHDRDHSITLALTRGIAGMVLSLMGRDPAAARQQVDALRGLSQAGLPFGPWADSLASRRPAKESQNEAGLQQMREGMATFQILGTRLGRPAQLLLLAHGYAQADEAEAGLPALDEALAWMDQSGVCMLEAEAHRLRGELLLAGRSPGMETADPAVGAAAEVCFRRAIAVARRQEARWWELRAAVSLSRLLKECDRPNNVSRAEARQALAAIYGWFTEGFETPDLQEARALLAEDR